MTGCRRNCLVAATAAIAGGLLWIAAPGGGAQPGEHAAGGEPAGRLRPRSIAEMRLPAPPPRTAGAAEASQECLDCHDDMRRLFEHDRHAADDFLCVTCHGASRAHVEQDVQGALPDRVWRRWVDEENAYRWRVPLASLEIARFCASCHDESRGGERVKTIRWKSYLATRHGRAVLRGDHDAPTCSDCHYAHGAGSQRWTPKRINEVCAICHGDRKMMRRAGVDPDVMDQFASGTHGDMEKVSAEKRASCAGCHPPHRSKRRSH